MWRLFLSLLVPLGLAANVPVSYPLDNLVCMGCRSTSAFIQSSVDSDTFISALKIPAVKICELFESREVCKSLIDQYATVVIHGLSSRFLDPNFLCYHPCYSYEGPSLVAENFNKWQEEVLQDAPAVSSWPVPSSNSFKFLHLSDVHIDLLYKEGSIVDCPDLTCCRYGDPAEGGAGHWGSFGKCDTPPRTVELFMEQVSKMELSFVLWTGDSPPHDVNNYSFNNHTEYANQVTSLFKKYLPDVPVYPVLGNHGCFPMDEFDPGNENGLLGKYAEIWKDYLDADSLSQFMENGYYSLKDKTTGIRILGLNTQLGDVFNFKIYGNSTDPGQMLGWMRNQLYAAEKSNENVYIFGHIPSGDHFTDSLWAKHYRVLINRFRNIIMGQFFGHSHNDHFQLISSLEDGQPPAGVILMVPSLTTYSFLNPSFRIYQADAESSQVLDYQQYRLKLSSANLNPDVKPEFELVYSGKSFYNLEDLSPASYQSLAELLLNDSEVFNKFYLNFYSSYEGEIEDCDSTCTKQLVCGTMNSVFNEYGDCAQVLGAEERLFKYLGMLIEPWLYVHHKA